MKKFLFFAGCAIALAAVAFRKRHEIECTCEKCKSKVKAAKDRIQELLREHEYEPALGTATSQRKSPRTAKKSKGKGKADPKQVCAPVEKPLGNSFASVNIGGALGVKKDGAYVVRPRKCFRQVRLVQGVPVLKDERGASYMLTPEKLFRMKEVQSKDYYLVGKRNGAYRVFIPSLGQTFKSHAFDLTPAGLVISRLRNKVTIWDKGTRLAKGHDFKRTAVLGDGTIYVLKDGAWFKTTIENGIITPTDRMAAKEVSVLKARRGWEENYPVMVLK
ncbi:MAG: hypothetical protein IJ545_03065 [Alphaproteobacteria bacterium]|nr:hypothetical protein [Alphaproteobacteria bacterium]